MRELKFRQWLGESFHYWGFLSEECTGKTRWVGPALDPRPGGAAMALLSSEQYACMKDRSGNDIYEGDVIQHMNTHVRAFRRLVIFSEGTFGFAGSLDGELMPLRDYRDQWSVIGNIHEHPELLDKKNGGK